MPLTAVERNCAFTMTTKKFALTKRSVFFHLDAADHENLKLLANRQRTSMSAILRQLTTRYIQQHQPKQQLKSS